MRTSAPVLAIFYLAVGIAPLFAYASATQLGSMDKVLAKRQPPPAIGDPVAMKWYVNQQYDVIQSHLHNRLKDLETMKTTYSPYIPPDHPLIQHLKKEQRETLRYGLSFTARRRALDSIPT
ncbi:hypothetical protein F5148DRAFT_1370827 [Russula earlei]|uniref:Uncharacterized protein n=1 Tax=Russula earlei TaxID=71964 RepID=A0ACC0TXG5_9AGAM|nr:hypothetical protein F5148DRAFT_1370827 [Russula earlei]